MYFLNRFLICFCSLLVCSGHRNCSKGHMQKGKIQNIVNSFNFSLKVILIFTAIDSTVMHLEQLIGRTRHPKKKNSITCKVKWKKSVSLRCESKPQLFIETRLHYSQARPQIMNFTSQFPMCFSLFFIEYEKRQVKLCQ